MPKQTDTPIHSSTTSKTPLSPPRIAVPRCFESKSFDSKKTNVLKSPPESHDIRDGQKSIAEATASTIKDTDTILYPEARRIDPRHTLQLENNAQSIGEQLNGVTEQARRIGSVEALPGYQKSVDADGDYKPPQVNNHVSGKEDSGANIPEEATHSDTYLETPRDEVA